MTGRHRGIARSISRRISIGAVAACAALATSVGAGGWVLVASGDACTRVPFSIVASADIAPAVAEAIRRVGDSALRIGRFCFVVRVDSRGAAQVAQSLANDGRLGSGPAPDAWVADSVVWVDQVRGSAYGSSTIALNNPSIARSPTVIAMPLPVARQFTASGQAGWGRLLEALNSAGQLRVGLPNPALNTTGLAALLAIADLTAGDPRARTELARLTRTLSQNSAEDVAELFTGLPKSADPAAIADSIAAIPATEQSVWRYNAAKPAVPLVAVHPSEGALQLDYPYVVTTSPDDRNRQQVARRLLAALQAPAAQEIMRNLGFRSPDGAAGAALSAAVGADPGVQPPNPTTPAPAFVAAVLKAWQTLRLSSRILVLIDTSGSMNTPVPGSTKTRLELTVSAAQQGLGIVGDDTELGLWIFSSGLEGKDQDYRELVPVGPLSEPVGDAVRRAALANALTRLQAKGNTGLYDSILAGYRSQLATYRQDKVGSVLVFTDGKNHDPDGGISLDQLLSTLQRESDPERPMPIFILAFGPDADMASATRIAEATAGAAYHADTPGQAYELYLDALGQRRCRPNC